MRPGTRLAGLAILVFAAGCLPDFPAPAPAPDPAPGGGSPSTGGTPSGGGGSPSTGGTPSGGTPSAMDALRQHCLDQLNAYRMQNGSPPLQLSSALNDFAQAGSVELSMDHQPHQHFISASQDGSLFSSGFSGGAAENQGDPNGWTPGPEAGAIDEILQAMMSEGPGGGHHDNIVSAQNHEVGVGLVEDSANRLFFTNDFSP
jgi:hypothetical protein